LPEHHFLGKLLRIYQRLTRLSEFIDTLKDNPVPFRKFDLKKLKGKKDRYRARLGDFRLTYQVDKKEKVILLLKLERIGSEYK